MPSVILPPLMQSNALKSTHGNLRAWRSWLQEVGIHHVNLAGRLYVTPEAVTEFEMRAKAGEFADATRTCHLPRLTPNNQASKAQSRPDGRFDL